MIYLRSYINFNLIISTGKLIIKTVVFNKAWREFYLGFAIKKQNKTKIKNQHPPPKKKRKKKTPKRTLKCLILPPEKKQLKKHLKIFKTWNGRVSQIFITCISTIIWRINTHNITNQAITGRLILHTLFQIISYLVNIEFLQFFKNLAVTFCQYRLNVCLFS